MSELIYHINSYLDRMVSDPNTNTWTSSLSDPIKVNGRSKIKVCIENVECPNSSYSLPSYAASLWWIESPATTATLRLLNLDIGRTFNATDFVTYINALMVTNGYNLVFSYSASTAKLTLTNNEAFAIRLVGSFRYSDTVGGLVSSNVCDRLGFNQDTIGTSIAAAGTLVANGCVRFLRTNCMYITMDCISNKIRQANCPSPYSMPNIVARVPAGTFGTLSVLRVASSFFYSVSEHTLESLTFSVLDDELQPLDLNGVPVTFSVRIIME